MDFKQWITALLMDRVELLNDEDGVLQQREEVLRNLLQILTKIPPALGSTKIEPAEQVSLRLLELEIAKLIPPSPVPPPSRGGGEGEGESEKIYDQALAQLLKGIQLDRGDAKKWPALSSEDKAVRVLTNYLLESPTRWVLEKPFREFNTVRHLNLSHSQRKNGFFHKAEEELFWAQQELRHVVAIVLGIDLIKLREEAETISQTTGRSEKEVTLELLDQYLLPKKKAFEQLSQALVSFLSQSKNGLGFVRLILPQKFRSKEVAGLKTEAEVLAELEKQNENLNLVLDSTASLNVEQLLKKALHLPEPKGHCYFRMPNIDRFKNIKILDAKKNILIEFDEQGRLSQAPMTPSPRPSPSRGEGDSNFLSSNLPPPLRGGGQGEGDTLPLDVAIIGAGPGGISAGVALSGLGIFRYAIFERSEINSTVRDIWSREKEADTFYSGPPDPIEGLVGMQDTTRAVFLNRMNTFVDYFHLNIRTREPVLKLYRGEGEQFWILETPQGTYKARNILMTAGRYGKPKLLKWEEGNIPQELQEKIVRGVAVDDIQNSTVLVIGGGNTAFDNVKSLIAHGTEKKKNTVYLSYYKKPFNVPGSLHAHNNDQLMQWESEGKLTILWNTNTVGIEEDLPLTPSFVKRGEENKKRWKILFKEGEQPASVIVDFVAPAVGWQIDKDMMEKVGVQFLEGGKPDCDPQTGQAYQTDAQGKRIPIPGLFIAGDYFWQRSVPAAFTTNFRAAVAIAKQLKE